MKLWRLILFIIIFSVFLTFIVFNLENTCDINFGIKVFENVPVFITIFFSFIVGVLFALPFMLSSRSRKKAKSVEGEGLLAKVTKKKGKEPDAKPAEPAAGAPQPDTDPTDKTLYGID